MSGSSGVRSRGRRLRAVRGPRSTAVAAVGALLVLAALQGRAVADSTPSGTGAPGVWQPAGKVLTGGATTAQAPRMEAAKTYRDSIRPDETRYYGITLDARSSAYASAFAVPPPGSRVEYGDGIELELESAGGDRCDSADAHFPDDDPRPIGTAVVRLIGVGTDCQDTNQYTLAVHRTSEATSDPGAWPLELRFVTEPALRADATTPRAPDFGSASPTPLITGSSRQTRGGTWFDTAPALRTGIWQDQVLPGETRFYRVPVDWGQQATVFADFSSAPATDDSAYISSGVRIGVYSPVRELIDSDDDAYDGSPTSLGRQLAPVSYGNRLSDDDQVARVRYAGWYYLAVTVHPEVAEAVDGPLPVTLRVDVKGTPQSAPAYDGDPGPADIGVDTQDGSSADGVPGGDAASSSGTSGLRFLAFAALGAGTVLVLGLAGWVVAARRGTARSGYGAPPGR